MKKYPLRLTQHETVWLFKMLESSEDIMPGNEMNLLILAVLKEFKTKYLATLYEPEAVNRFNLALSQAIAVDKLCRMVLANGFHDEAYAIQIQLQPKLPAAHGHLLN
jgi:hypothetical protein